MMKLKKRINIIIILMFMIGFVFTNCVYALGDTFSAADDFLGKR